MTKEIDLDDIEEYIKALHCPIRWDIIKILKDAPKTSNQIYRTLTKTQKINENSQKQVKEKSCHEMCFHANHKHLKKPTLYYHLRELESTEIIEGKKKIDEKGNMLKVKEWKLNLKTLIINLE
jgi:DNA-binding transcriptional ArsR family regulator